MIQYSNAYQQAKHAEFLRYGNRQPSNFDLFGKVTENLKQGYSNFKTVLEGTLNGHPLDAITVAAIDTAVFQEELKRGSPLSQVERQRIADEVTVEKVQEAAASRLKSTVGDVFDIFSPLKWYIIGAIVIILLVKLS